MAIKHVNPVEIMFVDRMLRGEPGEKGDTGATGGGGEDVATHESMYDHGDLHKHSNKGSLDVITVSGNELFINGQNYRDILSGGGTSLLPVTKVVVSGTEIHRQTGFCSIALADAESVQISYSMSIALIGSSSLYNLHATVCCNNVVLVTQQGTVVRDGDGNIIGCTLSMSGVTYVSSYAGETINFKADWGDFAAPVVLDGPATITLSRHILS